MFSKKLPLIRLDSAVMLTRVYQKLKSLNRKMLSTSTVRSADHLSTTKFSSRKEIVSSATVVKVQDESETVKVLTIQVHDKEFTFKAGQWVDTFIPGVETVGGYSMCSSPALLRSEGLMVLAIKFSIHPPAFWVHTKCKPGDTVLVRAGGDFFFDPDPGDQTAEDVLLIAGGVGINPLYSMINHVAHINSSPQGPYSGKVLLLYSARTCADLIFKDHLETLAATHSNITTHFFTSRESSVSASVKAGRITSEDIQNAVKELKLEKLKVYMCGPSPMILKMEEHCLSCHIAKEQLFYEQWW